MYYVRVNASDLDCGEETMNVEVSSSIYDNVVEGEYHEFTVVTDTLITGKKRVRIYSLFSSFCIHLDSYDNIV